MQNHRSGQPHPHPHPCAQAIKAPASHPEPESGSQSKPRVWNSRGRWGKDGEGLNLSSLIDQRGKKNMEKKTGRRIDTAMWIKDKVWLMLQNHPTWQKIQKCPQCSWVPTAWNHLDSHRILTERKWFFPQNTGPRHPHSKELTLCSGTSWSSCPIQKPI